MTTAPFIGGPAIDPASILVAASSASSAVGTAGFGIDADVEVGFGAVLARETAPEEDDLRAALHEAITTGRQAPNDDVEIDRSADPDASSRGAMSSDPGTDEGPSPPPKTRQNAPHRRAEDDLPAHELVSLFASALLGLPPMQRPREVQPPRDVQSPRIEGPRAAIAVAMATAPNDPRPSSSRWDAPPPSLLDASTSSSSWNALPATPASPSVPSWEPPLAAAVGPSPSSSTWDPAPPTPGHTFASSSTWDPAPPTPGRTSPSSSIWDPTPAPRSGALAASSSVLSPAARPEMSARDGSDRSLGEIDSSSAAGPALAAPRFTAGPTMRDLESSATTSDATPFSAPRRDGSVMTDAHTYVGVAIDPPTHIPAPVGEASRAGIASTASMRDGGERIKRSKPTAITADRAAAPSAPTGESEPKDVVITRTAEAGHLAVPSAEDAARIAVAPTPRGAAPERATASRPDREPARSTSEDRQEAAVDGVNRLAVRHGVVAEVVVPELGTVRVDAHRRGDALDVSIVADRAEVAAVIEGARGELGRELRQDGLRVASLEVSSSGAHGSPGSPGNHSGGSAASSRRDEDPRSRPQDPTPATTRGSTTVSNPARSQRVRIVL